MANMWFLVTFICQDFIMSTKLIEKDNNQLGRICIKSAVYSKK